MFVHSAPRQEEIDMEAEEKEEMEEDDVDDDDAMAFFGGLLGKHGAKQASSEEDSSQQIEGSDDDDSFSQPVKPIQGEREWDEGYDQPFYPGTGTANRVGVDDGEGYNVNFPWPTTGYGDLEYLYVMNEIVAPLAKEFEPDLILVSSGFDCADKDTLGAMKVTPSGFYAMTQLVTSLCPRVVVAMEGGYHLPNVARGSEAILRALMEPSLASTAKNQDSRMLLHQAHRQVEATKSLLASKGWTCFDPKREEPSL